MYWWWLEQRRTQTHKEAEKTWSFHVAGSSSGSLWIGGLDLLVTNASWWQNGSDTSLESVKILRKRKLYWCFCPVLEDIVFYLPWHEVERGRSCCNHPSPAVSSPCSPLPCLVCLGCPKQWVWAGTVCSAPLICHLLWSWNSLTSKLPSFLVSSQMLRWTGSRVGKHQDSQSALPLEHEVLHQIVRDFNSSTIAIYWGEAWSVMSVKCLQVKDWWPKWWTKFLVPVHHGSQVHFSGIIMHCEGRLELYTTEVSESCFQNLDSWKFLMEI